MEAFHEVSVFVTTPSGERLASTGDTDRPFFIRSSAKPFQAAVAGRLGPEMPPEWLALACASHDGDPVHVAIVSAMLASVGLSEDHLRCPVATPRGAGARRPPAGRGRLFHNCSGKHAAMLAACVVQGWDLSSYLDPGHPLQVEIATEMTRVFGSGALPVGVDGCGAPVFRVGTAGLAAGYARLGTDPAYRPVLAAITAYPALVSGVGNDDYLAAIWLGAGAKRGAEGCLGLIAPGRGALAVKVWDGNETRALPVALMAALDQVGWIPEGARPRLEQTWRRPVLGSGREVGTVRADFSMERV